MNDRQGSSSIRRPSGNLSRTRNRSLVARYYSYRQNLRKHDFSPRRLPDKFQEWLELQNSRKPRHVKSSLDEPLMSVVVATYNRSKTLTQRTLKSVLEQTYQNFEVIVVGDHCTDDTALSIESLADDRITFVNLPSRGAYPTEPRNRWLVAGCAPMNVALEHVRGEWIAPLDDDDEFSRDHLEALLDHAISENFEMVYGQVNYETPPATWSNVGEYPPGRIGHSSVLYVAYLSFFRYNIESWKYGEPADFNLWKRMWLAGVRVGFLDEIVGRKYGGTEGQLNDDTGKTG